jgi:hypothetical protein
MENRTLVLTFELDGQEAVEVKPASRIQVSKGNLLVFAPEGGGAERIAIERLRSFRIQPLSACFRNPSVVRAN